MIAIVYLPLVGAYVTWEKRWGIYTVAKVEKLQGKESVRLVAVVLATHEWFFGLSHVKPEE